MTTRRAIATILPACLALGLLAPLAARAAGPDAATAAASPAAGPGTTAPPAAGYRGHGVGSLDPAVLARFAPRPIDATLRRTIQQLLDLRAPPGGGLPSDDGRRLFFSWRVTGSTQIWRLDGPDRFPVQLTAGEDTTTVAAVTPDGRTLVVQRDRKGEENPGLYLMPADGGPLQCLQHLEGVQTIFERLSPDGRTLYYRANDRAPDAYALYARDLASGVTTTILAEPGLWSIADRRPDGRLLIARATGSLTSEWFEWSPATRALTPLLGQGESSELEVRYAAQEGELLVQTNKLGDLRRLHRWKGGALTPVTPELRWDVAGFAIDEAQRRILYSVNEGGYARLHALDARTFQPLPLPRLPAADQVNAGATTRDGRLTVISIDTGTAPRASWVLDWKSGALTRWVVPSAPEVDLSRFSRATLETYPARDGTSIPVFVSRPARCPAEPCPVLVSFHGGPEAQALPGFSPAIQLFLDAGFVVVQPNVRGSDGYGKAWLAADDGPRRLQVVTDIEDAGRWARKAFAANGQAPRVGVMGGSYGGYSTLIAMTMFAGTFDAGASNVGISNLVTFLENTAPYRRLLRISEYGDPVKDRDVLLKLSPITYVDRVKGPLLIMQGASDPRVPAGEAVQIHDALAARGVPVELLIFPDEGHGAQKRENVAQALGRQLEFFKKYLGAAPGEAAASAPARSAPPPAPPTGP